VLENCWENNLRNKNVLDQIFSYEDKYVFFGVNKIDILFYNYNDINFWYSEEEGKFYINLTEDIENGYIKIFDYYTDLCIYNNSNFSLNKETTLWLVPPFFNGGSNNKNGYYLEFYNKESVIRKNILINDFDFKHQFSKKFLTYKNENINFLFGYLDDFKKIYESLKFENIRNFVDLGANYGISSIFFMEKNIKCYLVDADTRMINLLKSNFGKNSNNKVIHQAIYSHDGVVDFFEDNDCSMVSSISEIDANNKMENKTKNIVSCITPNTLIEEIIDEDYIDLMKIDIEGAEYDLFNTISDENLLKINNLLIEYHNNDNYQILEIINKLTFNNYKFKFMDGEYPIENKGGLIYAWK
jgi:FkbM family methyltransferase